jgi:TetR/AcrR family fatty acid metabolism transcriptional regulator
MKGVDMPRSEELSAQMRAESRSQLIAAARRVFAQKGYFNTKVSDIAREAEMSQGNLYWYFEGKEGLLKAVLAEGFEAIESTTAQVAEQPSSAGEKIDQLVARFVELYRQRGNFTTILLSLMAHGGLPFIQSLGFNMLEIGARYHANVGRVFAQAQEEGLVDEAPETLVRYFFAFFNGLFITYGDDFQDMPLESLQVAVRRLCGAKIS